MTHPIDARLDELGIALPTPPAPAANYVPFVITGNQLYVSGQLPVANGAMMTGKLGADLDVAGGAQAARACAINLIAQLKIACGGDFDRFDQVVKLTAFVNSTPEFADQPKVVNGASDLMGEVFGEAGKHARSAVSAASLPFGVAVEIDAVFALK